MKNKKLNYSLTMLNHLSNEALYDVISSNKYDDETRTLARRVVSSRQFQTPAA